MYEYRATCVHVVDGDTVDLVIDLGFHMSAQLRCRLLGVNTPELFGTDSAGKSRALGAKAYVKDRILGKQVLVRTEKSDSFGRWLADIIYDGNNLSDELITSGLGDARG